MDYIQLDFPVAGEARELLIARLSEAGIEAFEETDNGLKAFVSASQYDDTTIETIARENNLEFALTTIPQQNWNATWEASFEPVIVPGFCTVRAAFHEKQSSTPYDIIITPKMSFGTGHHATTRKMMDAMKEVDFKGKVVLDFGTGTGILAILAAMLGAQEVLAIDNDDWSVENAVENVQGNNVQGVSLKLGSLEDAGTKTFDIILANINRHILLQYMTQMRQMLKHGGILLLSGILTADKAIITASANAVGFKEIGVYSEGDWLALKFNT